MSKRPVLVSMSKESVRVLELAEGTDGVLAVPMERAWRYLGDVFKDDIVIDGTNRKRWFSTTSIDITLGPFTTKQEAVREMLTWYSLVQVSVKDTSAPLF